MSTDYLKKLEPRVYGQGKFSEETWKEVDVAFERGVSRRAIYDAMLKNNDMPYPSLDHFQAAHVGRRARKGMPPVYPRKGSKIAVQAQKDEQ